MDLEEARKEIMRLDTEMAGLFVRRMEAVRVIASWKKERGIPIEDKAQEEKIIEAHGREIPSEDLRPFYVRFLKDVIKVSKEWQQWLMEQ